MLSQGYRDVTTPQEMAEAAMLLRDAGLDMPEYPDRGLAFHEDGRVVATAFLAGNVICGVCVAPSHRERGLAAALVGRLLTQALGAGMQRLCIFTRVAEADKFVALGFGIVATSPDAAMLEYGIPDYAAWIGHARTALQHAVRAMPRTGSITLGAVVMNANPFTLGHRALVREATARCAHVAVFVVEEDVSAFPFADRFALVREGTSDIAGAVVLPAGPYMVSRGSFPAYFTGKAEHAAVHAGLDACLFATRIAPDLGIGMRFVGEEPYCEATATYNKALLTILPAHGVACREIARRRNRQGVISASRVREILRTPDYPNRTDELRRLVPPTTLAFLLSQKGQAVAAALRGRTGRH